MLAVGCLLPSLLAGVLAPAAMDCHCGAAPIFPLCWRKLDFFSFGFLQVCLRMGGISRAGGTEVQPAKP